MNTTPINWEAIAGGLAIAAALAALIAWQVRGSADKCRGWLGSSAMTLEALAMAMAVTWSVKQGGGFLTIFFAGGFIGLALSKAVTISALVHAYQIKRHSAFMVTLLALIGAYATVYSAGVFEGTMHSAKTQGDAAAVSAPVQAVEAEIASVQARINGLAGFADASKAQQDEQSSQAVQASLAAKRAALAACPKNYVTNCIKPLRAEIAALEHNNGTGYASRNAQYTGLQTHLATLQRQRADLLSAGGGVETANSADDRLIMWLFGLDTLEQAASIKWIIFVAVFDCLSLLLRLGGELLLGQDLAGNAARRMRALVESGLSADQAAQTMSGHQAPPAYRYGGAVTHTGPAVVHGTPDKPEYVLSPEMTDHLGGAKALDTIREQVHGKARYPLDDVKRSLSVPLSDTLNDVKRVPSAVAGKRGKGRQGLIDTCLHCGQDYTVKAWTQVCCCPDCTAQLSGYADQAARQAAWNKGKKSA